MMRRRVRRSDRRRGVSTIISAVLLVAITVVLVGVLYAIRIPLPTAPPTIGYSVDSNERLPAWGDPTDCYPNLPYLPSYYLRNGSGDPRWNTYMNAWNNDCENGDTGHYNQMNVSQIVITQVSRIIPLASVQFAFVCTNTTPTYISNDLVKGSLAAMSWFPGESQSNLSASAPKLASCATFNASNYGGGANGVYYNRLWIFRAAQPERGYPPARRRDHHLHPHGELDLRGAQPDRAPVDLEHGGRGRLPRGAPVVFHRPRSLHHRAHGYGLGPGSPDRGHPALRVLDPPVEDPRPPPHPRSGLLREPEINSPGLSRVE